MAGLININNGICILENIYSTINPTLIYFIVISDFVEV